jgi:hypothetical protein
MQRKYSRREALLRRRSITGPEKKNITPEELANGRGVW